MPIRLTVELFNSLPDSKDTYSSLKGNVLWAADKYKSCLLFSCVLKLKLSKPINTYVEVPCLWSDRNFICTKCHSNVVRCIYYDMPWQTCILLVSSNVINCSKFCACYYTIAYTNYNYRHQTNSQYTSKYIYTIKHLYCNRTYVAIK